MPDIFFSKRLMCPGDLVGDDPNDLASFLKINGLGLNDSIAPGKAYSLDTAHPQTRTILTRINGLPAGQRSSIARAAEELGDGVNQLALFLKHNLDREQIELVNSLVGASASAASARLNGFQSALLKYQEAVLEGQKVEQSHGPGVGQRRHQAQTKIRYAYSEMSNLYRRELNRLSPEALRSKNRGNALSNPHRAITLAQRRPLGKPDARLFIADTAEASRMASFGRGINNLGKVALAVDAGLRIHKVNGIREDGGDWLREGAMQMTGLGAAGAAGGLAGKYTVLGGGLLAAKAGLVLTGPAGWAIVAAIVGAGIVAGLATGMVADRAGKALSAWLWEWDLAWD
ncbi:hypothetical protein [Hydrocarboniclastica marina]|uniref:Uncharacterized protein n=1 Tax=Hydrocarboniclastica marina TaxID=2259620 RepID=A0A4P7XM85_9ALTE|nr:hypothetical protein [Hydrocarboniclastica marina]QCF27147.1 hypothetical protein soil367_15065 [Hydrocarboniclastica marina]